jgi:hypothetical protein
VRQEAYLHPLSLHEAFRGGLLQMGLLEMPNFWVSDLSTARDSNPKMGLDFRFVLLEIASERMRRRCFDAFCTTMETRMVSLNKDGNNKIIKTKMI